MKSPERFIVFLFLPLALACSFHINKGENGIRAGNGIRGNGEVREEKRTVPDFDRVENDGIIDIRFKRGDGPLVVRTDSNLIPEVRTKVQEHTLQVDLEESVSRASELEVQIPVEKGQLKGIDSDGTGDMVSEDPLTGDEMKVFHDATGDMDLTLNYEKLEYVTDGTGDSELSGSVDHLRVKNTGTGDIKAFELKAANVECSSDGTGDTEIHASKTLKVQLTGTGDVIHRGSPDLEEVEVDGTGELEKR